MNDLMLFCTCAENNKSIYLNRMEKWFENIKEIPADFYCFVDGTLAQEDKNRFPKIKFICNPSVLGMWHGSNHAGWKRSLVSALQVGRQYKKIAHIENDVMVFRPQNVYEKILYYDGCCSGWASDGDYIETAIMALNDKEVNDRIINFYSQECNLYRHEVTEKRIQSFSDFKVVFTGNNNKIWTKALTFESKFKAIKQLGVDYWGQFFDEYYFETNKYRW